MSDDFLQGNTDPSAPPVSTDFLQGTNTPVAAPPFSSSPPDGGSGPPVTAPVGGAAPFDFNTYAAGIRHGESGNDYQSGTPGTSSASGAYQFIQGTWNQFKPPGAPATAREATPAQQDQAFQAFTTQNAKALQASGVPIDPLNLSIAHQQGAGGAIALAKAPPDKLAKDFVKPESVAGNKPFFYAKDGTPLTVAQSRAKFADFYQVSPGSRTAVASAAPKAAPQNAAPSNPSFLQGTKAPPAATQQEAEEPPLKAPVHAVQGSVSSVVRGKDGKTYFQRYGKLYDEKGNQVQGNV